ncbi:chloride channel protein [Weissella diestrammenae]|uniref:Chloride channel protein n=1 Tax=Weissella diestrammenae TaxID=1162633 RepID=A0A7G9T429_9LACO|nr:chloride channel protein [Weissella diestrammenae]MCM0583376.1 chloride channel protein [Weissella diestrammenae]QNN74854.1 chloride channel protein [Weissella diestrammenae]
MESVQNKQSKNKSDEQTRILIISTIVLGVIVGLSALVLSLFLDGIERLFLSFEETSAAPSATMITGGHRLISVVIGGVIAAVVWYFLRTRYKPVIGINQALKGEKMPWVQTVIDVITQIMFVGTGGSVGRELAPREAGAMLAQRWSHLVNRLGLPNLTQENQRLLIAAAAGAGFAGIYIAPITGMLFCVEILLKQISPKTVTVSLSMSIIAMLVGSLVKGFKPYYLIHDTHFTLIILPFVIIAGPLIGIAGAFFRQTFKWAEKQQSKDKNILWQLPLAAVLTGIVAMRFPQIMGNGRALAQLSMNYNQQMFIGMLVFGAMVKAIVTVLTIRSGAAGGTLTPSIAIGSALGVLIGVGFNLMGIALPLSQTALLGAGILLAASQQAPLMALFMIFEVSHLNYSAFLPLGLGVALAYVSSQIVLRKRN